MDRKEANASREGLLNSYHARESIPLRKSLEEAYRASSDEEDSDIDATDFLNTNQSSSAERGVSAYEEPRRLARLRATIKRRSKCLLILLAVIVAFWVVMGGTGFWMYKKTPLDGLSPPWYPTPPGGTDKSWEESYKKAAELVRKMTLPEKVNITTGTGWQMGLAVGNTAPAVNVGFPALALQDGPLGLRFADNATAFPAGITVGATWNRELMYLRGKAHGKEARLKGINVLLGPCVGPIGRMPAGGRNWEGFGADPVLQGVAAAETIRGIQEQGVIATIKHFVGNEQEHFRQSWEWGLPNALSSNIGDRALHEIYAWPFANAVKAGVGSVMCSYQMTNNSYSCGNSKLLNGILKDELGFQGFVQSDWLAQRSGVASALAGLDVSMPGDGLTWAAGKSLWGPELSKAVLNGSLPIERLNDMVTRVVAAWYQMGQDDKSKFDGKGPNFSSWTNDKDGFIYHNSPSPQEKQEVNRFVNVQGEGDEAHSIIARRVATEGTVLLKNQDNALPLKFDSESDEGKPKIKIAIFGEDAGEGKGPNACPDRGCNQGTLASGWGSGAVEFPYLITPLSALRKAFDAKRVTLSEFPTNSPPFGKNPGILQDQDVCIVFVNSDSGEGYMSADGIHGDRNDLFLQKGGDDLIGAVSNGCGGGKGNTIVVVHSVGPVILEEWIDKSNIKGVIWANLPGQESGNAIADIITGKVNPSGKLPYTIGKSLKDYGEGGKILYYANGVVPQQDFKEGLYIDYRYFDKADIVPRFEFGFGLSYTTFEYSNLTITKIRDKTKYAAARPQGVSAPDYDKTIPDPKEALAPKGLRKLAKVVYPYIDKVSDIKKGEYPYPVGYDIKQTPSPVGGAEGGNPDLWTVHANVSITITNTGPVAGAEVVQLYLKYDDVVNQDPKYITLDFPVKVLRGFEKVFLEKGESKTVTMSLNRRDLSYWSVEEQTWILPTEGTFIIRVGASSRDFRLTGWF